VRKRQRIAADVAIGAARYGQAGDAVVDTVAPGAVLDTSMPLR
jgi:hypothetical protein